MAEKMSSSTDEPEEVAGELDDALNELGMLSALSQDKNRNRSDFIKDKWSAAGRRGYPLRYPLRREKEREITWCSGSSSSSSTGSSSRRSSSTSSSGGSFSSNSGSCYSRSYSRSSLISSYSIAETPTGIAPGPFGSTTTTSSNSSLCSSIDLMDQPMSGVTTCVNNFKSIDFPKVLRRVHHQSYKPYNLGKPSRRFSLQLGIHREERSSFGPSPDNLNLRSGLSDSEASSGSGTGTPPPSYHPPHPPSNLSFQGCTLILDPGFNLRLKSPLMFKETKSNPGSPTNSASRTDLFRPNEQFRCDYRNELISGSGRNVNQALSSQEQLQQDSVLPGTSGESGSGMSMSSLGFLRCLEGGGIPSDLNVTCCYQSSSSNVGGNLTRSKSLDDLNYALLLQDNNSSCSSDAFGFSSAAGGNQPLATTGPMATSIAQYDIQRLGSQEQQQELQLRQQRQIQQPQQCRTLFNLNEQSDQLSSSSSNFLPSCQQQLQQRVCSSSSSNLGPSCSLGQVSSSSSCTQQQLPPVISSSGNQPQLLQPNSQVPVSSSSCDNLFESVVQRIGRLEM